jgi:DNA-binding NtrC family response regulator
MSRHPRELLLAGRRSSLLERLSTLLQREALSVVHDVSLASPTVSTRRGIGVVVFADSDGAADQLIAAGRAVLGVAPQTELILVTGRGSEGLAVAALRAGFADYLNQDASDAEITSRIGSVLAHTAPPERLPPRSHGLVEGHRMIGETPGIGQTKDLIARIAPTDSNVLITGETGTGKELAAELIHKNSPRRGRPFVCINCAAIPDGLLESELFGYERGAFTGAHTANNGKLGVANGGTVFFDEIGDMSPYAQAKILRAIETKEVQRLGGHRNVLVDVRIVAGTNQDLDTMVRENKFRSDLYFRLNVARIHLPPLRERKRDIQLLLRHSISELNQRFGRRVCGLTPSALDQLLAYDWPGNVRELRNLLEAMFLTLPGSDASIVDIPESVRARLGATNGHRPHERERLMAALVATNWNKSKAAEQLHWSRMTLYRKISKYKLNQG